MFTLIFKAKSLSQLPAADIHDNSRSACVCVCVNSEFEVFCPLRALSKNKDGKSFILQSTKLSKKKTTQQHECVLCCGDTRSPTHTHGLFQSVKASVQVFAHACSGCNGGDSSDD